MSTILREPRRLSIPTKPVPLLENGDHLTRTEFERRYLRMPDLKKAELITGEVFMGSPVGVDNHGAPHADLMGWLAWYRSRTPGMIVVDNGTIRLDDENELQPDAAMMILCGGQSSIDVDGYFAAAPELVAEVAASSASRDLHRKSKVYERFGVREYIVWRTYDEAIDWNVLQDGKFIAKAPDADGIHRSVVFPGLWLDPTALIGGDLRRVDEVLRQGLATPEHDDFVKRINA